MTKKEISEKVNVSQRPQKVSGTQVLGIGWSAEKDGEGYFLEYDIGSHAMKYVQFRISNEEFNALKQSEVSARSLVKLFKQEQRPYKSA